MRKLITITFTALLLFFTPILTEAASITYTVKKGDTLTSIGKKYNVTAAQIKKESGLKSDKIKIGQKLKVPKIVFVTYKVKKVDTLKSIAKKYKTTEKQLKAWNNLKSSKVKVGQTLKVSIKKSTTTKPSESTKPTTPTKPSNSTVEYTVEKGDTLTKIATKYRTTVANIKLWNSLGSDNIYVGQKLSIKTDGSSTIPTVPENPSDITPEEKPGDNGGSDSSNNYLDLQGQNPLPSFPSTYTVVKGDSLSSISQRFAITIDKIKKDNNLQSNVLSVGQKLVFKPITSSEIINIAKKYVGVPYLFGGNSEAGLDCSGYIYKVYVEAGLQINRLSTAGYFGVSKYVASPKLGQLVFFKDTYIAGPSHMGIYIGNGEFMHADSTLGVTTGKLSNSYYTKHFLGYGIFR